MERYCSNIGGFAFVVSHTSLILVFCDVLESNASTVSFNSVVFSSIPAVATPRAVVTSDFESATDNWMEADPLAHGAHWELSNYYGETGRNKTVIYSLQEEVTGFARLENRECLERYINPLKATSSLVVVARNLTSILNGGSSFISGGNALQKNLYHSAGWMCSFYWTEEQKKHMFCGQQEIDKFANDWILHNPPDVRVDHCLVGPSANNDERCGLHYGVYICIIVCVCTLLGALAVFWVWLDHHRVESRNTKAAADYTALTTVDPNQRSKESGSESVVEPATSATTKTGHHHRLASVGSTRGWTTLVTMGDAIHSFLESPEAFGGSQRNVATEKEMPVIIKNAEWVLASTSWSSAASKTLWAVSLVA